MLESTNLRYELSTFKTEAFPLVKVNFDNLIDSLRSVFLISKITSELLPTTEAIVNPSVYKPPLSNLTKAFP